MSLTSAPILILFGISLVTVLFFVLWESRTSHPALDLRLFHSRLYDFSVLAAMFQSLAIFAVQFLVAFYLQAVRGYSPLSAAFALLPLPILNALVGPMGGIISDKIGARWSATVGLLIQAAALGWLSTITATSSYLQVAIGLALTGLGGGLFWSPNTSAAMGAAPAPRLGIAAAALATFRNMGMVTSFALALAVAANAIPRNLMLNLFIGTALNLGSPLMVAFVDGMQAALKLSVVICVMAAGLSFVRGPKER